MLVALLVTSVAAGLVSVAVLRTGNATRMTTRAVDFADTERAVEGLIEYAFGVWKTRTVQKDSPLTDSEAAALVSSAPTFPALTYASSAENGPLQIKPTDAFGAPSSSPAKVLTYLHEYPGWRGFTYSYLASAKLQQGTGARAPRAGAKRLFQYIEVPLFQSMFFFEHDLEIYRPAQMIVGGLVHTNSRLLVSGSADQSGAELTFTGKVSYGGGTATVAGYTTKEPPIGGPEWAGIPVATAPSKMEDPTYSGGGYDAQVSKTERYEPLGKKPAEVLNATDTNKNNDSFRELIEPPVTTAGQPDPPEIAKRRLYNKAGIVLEINGSTVNVTGKNGTNLSAAKVTALKTAYTSKSTVWDEREGKKVDMANIDMSKITTELNSGVTGFNGVFYIHDITPVTTSGSSPDPEPKTLRLQKGGTLPNSGLTVVSQNPIYVQGDYNTGTTTTPTSVPANATGNPDNTSSPVVSGYQRKPAAVIGDAVMFLSNSWNDANATKTRAERVASNTTYNMAVMTGFIPSGWDPDGSSGSKAPYGYSGGANNFPRFLEDWAGRSCTYYGSMVELFRSETLTGEWDTGNIYRPPSRRWNYDTLFNTTPPPGSLDAVAIARGAWSKF